MRRKKPVTKRVKRTCLQCGKEFDTWVCQINRGGGKFCSIGCGIKHRNLRNNPAQNPQARRKISENHADFSGQNNPMYGVRGKTSPGYIDGRDRFKGDPWRKIAFLYHGDSPHVCAACDRPIAGRSLHVHHKDKNRKNNSPGNLMIVCPSCHTSVFHPKRRNEKGQFVKEVV